jgi:muramoyltetrapeptide carboxypeptidase
MEDILATIPGRLKIGDTIGIVSPSNPVVEEIQEQYNQGVAFVEQLGFKLAFGKYTHSTAWGYAASPQEKAQDINHMFADAAVKAILCTQGGYSANACLPYLDWEIIRRNPKIILGISDITVLLNAIHTKTGLITFHGNDLIWGFGRNPTPYDINEFRACLMQGRIGKIPANGKRKSVRSGTATGRLLGGNLTCLLKLAGTPYWPDFNDAILAIEAIDVPPASLDHMFQQLKQMGIFNQIKGILTGTIDGLDNDPEALIHMEEVLLRITGEFSFPILKANDFGHNCPNTTLPIGGQIQFNADDCTITILEDVVQ